MELAIQEGSKTLIEAFKTCFSQIEKSDPAGRLRSTAWDHFLDGGLPHHKDELFRYFPLRRLYSHDFQAALSTDIDPKLVEEKVLPECKGSFLVFINGFYREDLSSFSALPEKCDAVSFSKGVRKYSAFLTNHWRKTLKKESDPFVALNAALHGEGCFFYLPPNLKVEVPLQILNFVTASSENGEWSFPRFHLFCGRSSEIRLSSSLIPLEGSLSQPSVINQVHELALEEGARVHHEHRSCEGDAFWHFKALRATLKRDAYLYATSFSANIGTVREDYAVTLEGENGDAYINGLAMLEKKEQLSTNVLMRHLAPHCHSSQLFKTVLDGSSRASFEGKIFVDKIAQKTDAFQLNNNLLLNDGAIAYSKPNLEIFADDVKASHGSTVGQFSEEELFYLRSRGMNDRKAKALLLQGFCKEILEGITLSSERKKITKTIAEMLQE